MAAATAAPVSPAPSSLSRWTPSIPTNLINILNPFATTPSNDAANPADRSMTESAAHVPRSLKPSLAALAHHNPHSPSRSPSVMFAEPESRGSSEAGSRDGSVEGSRRLRRGSRPKTAFSICHPPPTSAARQKLHRRPRSLLQLHRLRANGRPMPAFEAIPSGNFSVRITRAITKVFKARHSLCPNDIVVLKAEKYTSGEDEDEHEAQDIVGLICKGRKDEDKGQAGKMRIYMASGREWEAYATTNGGYEFFSTDEHGLGMTLRWVPKRNKDGSKATMKDGSKRFNFSTISPHTRRHPVIASLCKTGLEINDSYKIPDMSGPTPKGTPKQSTSVLADVMEQETGESTDQIITDDALREIITMTAIWATFKEGWSASLRYDDKEVTYVASSSPSKSFLADCASPPASPLLTANDKRGSIKSISSGIVRRASLLSKGASHPQRSSTISTDDGDALASPTSRSPSVDPSATGGRARADSSSTVLVHRAATNRRNITTAQAAWRPDLLSPGSAAIAETSREDLAVRGTASLRSPSPLSGKGGRDKDKSGASISHRRAKSDGPAKGLLSLVKDHHRAASPARNSPRAYGAAGVIVRGDGDDDSSDDSSDDSEADHDEQEQQRNGNAQHRIASASTSSKTASLAEAEHSASKRALPPPATEKTPKKRPNWRKLLCGRSSLKKGRS